MYTADRLSSNQNTLKHIYQTSVKHFHFANIWKGIYIFEWVFAVSNILLIDFDTASFVTEHIIFKL